MAIPPLRTVLFCVLAAEWLALKTTLVPTAYVDPALAIAQCSADRCCPVQRSGDALTRAVQLLCVAACDAANLPCAHDAAAMRGCVRCSESAMGRFHTAMVMRAATPALTLTTEVYR
jgi:hypothetical protein